jgi:hypothetical protein
MYQALKKLLPCRMEGNHPSIVSENIIFNFAFYLGRLADISIGYLVAQNVLSTVVADVISDLCGLLGIQSEAEQQEFSLYCIVQGDAFTMPIAADEYILDVTTELLKSGQPF